MKCTKESLGMIGIISMIIEDIIGDKSENSMTECIELIESQLETIKHFEKMEKEK